MYKSSGFSIIAAIFILVVLSLIAAFLVRVLVNNRESNSILLKGQRAFFAAKSGLEWGLTTVAANPTGPCPVTTNFNINQGGLSSGFNVTVSCTLSSGIYTITSVATNGTFGAFEYVTRTVVGTYG